jgi:hypothetical protein
MPVRRAAEAAAPPTSATDRNSMSTEGRWWQTLGPVFDIDIVAGTGLSEQHMEIARRHQDQSGMQGIVVFRFFDFDR